MAKYVKLTEIKKSAILTLASLKMSTRNIARKVGFSQSAVTKFLKKYHNTGLLARKKGTGPKRKTSMIEDRRLKRICLSDRFKSAVDIRSELIEAGGSEISVETVRRRLRESGLKARSPAKKPFLNKRMRAQRLKWAKTYKNWTEEDWQNVIFSDKSKFCLFGSEGIHYVRRKTGERLDEKCIRQTVKHPAGQMVWGCFSYYGVGTLHFVHGNVDADVYQRILKYQLIPAVENHYSYASTCFFQDDSAPCHRAKRVSIFNF